MKPLRILFCCILLSAFAKAEDAILTINGVTNQITLGKESSVTLHDGVTLKVLVASKPYALYSGKLCSFEYTSEHKPEVSKDKHDDTTVTFMTSSGANVIIAELSSMSTEGSVEIILKRLTKDEIANGYSSAERKIAKSVSGGTFSGKEVTTTYHKKEKIHQVLEYRGKNGGILITVFFSREDAVQAEKFLEHFWRTMKITKEANPQGGANGSQPPSSETNRTSAAAGSRRSH